MWFDVAVGASEALSKEIQRAIERLEIDFPASPHGRVTVSAGIVDVVPSDETDVAHARPAAS